MIVIGLKTEEYREIKPYWIKRLFTYADGRRISNSDAKYYSRNIRELRKAFRAGGSITPILYTHIKFYYGYTKRTAIFKIESSRVGKGEPEWGAPAEDVFIFKLGERI